MIIEVPILDHGRASNLVKEMHQLRSVVFKDILEWDVTVDHEGCEKDQFDCIPGSYLIAVNEAMEVQASLRLLPTTGPYMAADVFSELLDRKNPPRSAAICESSRFFARPSCMVQKGSGSRYWATNRQNQYVAELICGLGIYTRNYGLTNMITVFDVAVERFMKSMGFEGERLGDPKRIGNTRAVAGIFGTEFSQVKHIADTWGFCLDSLYITASDLAPRLDKLKQCGTLIGPEQEIQTRNYTSNTRSGTLDIHAL